MVVSLCPPKGEMAATGRTVMEEWLPGKTLPRKNIRSSFTGKPIKPHQIETIERLMADIRKPAVALRDYIMSLRA